MKELSIFLDEAGDFGEYQSHSPFYLVTMVIHDQSIDITPDLLRLHNSMRQRGIPDYTVHAGPIIRREGEFRNVTLAERKMVFDSLFHFVRVTDIKYHTLIVEKKQCIEDIDLVIQISKKLSAFLFENMEKLMQYNRVVVYYDYGQMELTNILVSIFSSFLSNVEFKKVAPADYKLFQAADMLCTLELIALKADKKMFSKSENVFFSSAGTFKKAYLKVIRKKRFQ